MRVYIAGPYGKRKNLHNAEIEQNVKAAMEATARLIEKGHNPFCPHLYHYVAISNQQITEDTWLKFSLEWLEQCQAILMLPNWNSSFGATTELNRARLLGLEIYYNIDEVSDG